MDAFLVERILSDDGRSLLDSLPSYDPASVMALTTRLRAQGHDPELVSAVLTQSALRHRAVEKFGPDAARMFFTPDGLEQATRPRIADGHAARFAAAGVNHVYDLGCGIGSDARAFARAGLAVHAFDLDPATAAIARANLPGGTTVSVEDVTTADVPSHVGVWLDPARRTSGVADITGRTRRTFRLEDLLPSWNFVTALGASGRAVGAKLSPSFPRSALPDGASAQWTSLGGEVLECCVWFGPVADDSRFTARVLTATDDVVIRSEHIAAETDSVDGLAAFLYEADRAVVRAGVTGALADAVDGTELAPGLGHVTGDVRVDVPYARRYRVREAVPFNIKNLRAWLRSNDIGRVTVKKRGVRFDDARFVRDLKLKGDASALILVTRLAQSQIVLVLEPDDSDEPDPRP